jgi:hypothetical protein
MVFSLLPCCGQLDNRFLSDEPFGSPAASTEGGRLGSANREEVGTVGLRPPATDRFEDLADLLVQVGHHAGADQFQAMAVSLGTVR